MVLETGSPVTHAVGEARRRPFWKHGTAASDGANALGNVLFGIREPERQAAQHFPAERRRPAASHVDQPPPDSEHFYGPASREQWAAGLPPFQVAYDEGVKVGYKWYDAEKKPVLFPFGFGLSYTTFGYSGLKVDAGRHG